MPIGRTTLQLAFVLCLAYGFCAVTSLHAHSNSLEESEETEADAPAANTTTSLEQETEEQKKKREKKELAESLGMSPEQLDAYYKEIDPDGKMTEEEKETLAKEIASIVKDMGEDKEVAREVLTALFLGKKMPESFQKLSTDQKLKLMTSIEGRLGSAENRTKGLAKKILKSVGKVKTALVAQAKREAKELETIVDRNFEKAKAKAPEGSLTVPDASNNAMLSRADDLKAAAVQAQNTTSAESGNSRQTTQVMDNPIPAGTPDQIAAGASAFPGNKSSLDGHEALGSSPPTGKVTPSIGNPTSPNPTVGAPPTGGADTETAGEPAGAAGSRGSSTGTYAGGGASASSSGGGSIAGPVSMTSAESGFDVSAAGLAGIDEASVSVGAESAREAEGGEFTEADNQSEALERGPAQVILVQNNPESTESEAQAPESKYSATGISKQNEASPVAAATATEIETRKAPENKPMTLAEMAEAGYGLYEGAKSAGIARVKKFVGEYAESSATDAKSSGSSFMDSLASMDFFDAGDEDEAPVQTAVKAKQSSLAPTAASRKTVSDFVSGWFPPSTNSSQASTPSQAETLPVSPAVVAATRGLFQEPTATVAAAYRGKGLLDLVRTSDEEYRNAQKAMSRISAPTTSRIPASADLPLAISPAQMPGTDLGAFLLKQNNI